MASEASTWFTDDEFDTEPCPACGEKKLLPPLELAKARVCLACDRVVFAEE